MVLYTKYQLLWCKFICLTVVSNLKEKLDKQNQPQNDKSDYDKSLEYNQHLKWRLAYNLYLAGEYEDSSLLFNEVAIEENLIKNRFHYYLTSFIYQIAGRCNVQIFLKTFQHSYIEVSYKYYRAAVENLSVANALTSYKLPILLLEFGRVLEYYGAFEAANDVYTRILTSFPNFKGYFNALYRSAIIGKHLSNLITDTESKEESINKCTDILQFLLEALPSSISEIEVLLLYGRTLEMSSNPQIRFRANAIYRSLFELCRANLIANANTSDAVSWLANPNSWFMLAEYIGNLGESLIAKDAYDKYLEIQQALIKKTKGTNSISSKQQQSLLSDRMTVESCLKLAKNASQFQNYEDAIKYCELGLQIDKYNKELRNYLSKLSNTHAIELHHESLSLNKILAAWKGRCWTDGFRRKLKEKVIEEYENRYKDNQFDIEARENLAYYAKNKYRSQFLFEHTCIIRIQRFYRQFRLRNMWLNGQKHFYSNKSSEIYAKYQRLPWDNDIRKEVLSICSTKVLRIKLKNHPIHQARKIIEVQNKSIESISCCYKAYHIRDKLAKKIQKRKYKNNMKILYSVISIQNMIRKFLEFKREKLEQDHLNERNNAIIIIQRYIRKRYSSPEYMDRINAQKLIYRKRRSQQLLKKKFYPIIIGYLTRKCFNIKNEIFKRKINMESERKKHLALSVVVQRLSGLIRTKAKFIRMKKAVKDIRNRNSNSYSIESQSLLSMIDNNANNNNYQYHIPGLNPNHTSYKTLSQKKTIYCNERNGFTTADCMMLSIVIRSNISMIRELIFHNLDNFEYEVEILNICRKSTSLRSIQIIGGCWRSLFLKDLIHIIKVENPRINTLVIDKLRSNRSITDTISMNIGYLLLDYFNYSIPGIKKLCLHDCLLSNINLDLLAKGLEVNTSLESLTLSLNLIDDHGFILLFYSIYKNKKSKIHFLDFSSNLIKNQDHLIDKMFEQYEPLYIGSFLTLYLINNPIKKYYYPNSLKNLLVIYTIDDLKEYSTDKHITRMLSTTSTNNNDNNNNNNDTNINSNINKLSVLNKKGNKIINGNIKQTKSLTSL